MGKGITRKRISAKKGGSSGGGGGGTVTGTGASPQIAVWTGASALTGYSRLIYDVTLLNEEFRLSFPAGNGNFFDIRDHLGIIELGTNNNSLSLNSGNGTIIAGGTGNTSFKILNNTANTIFDSNGNILTNISIINDIGGNNITNCTLNNCVINFNGLTGCSLTGSSVESGAIVVFMTSDSIESTTVCEGATLNMNGKTTYCIIGNGSTFTTPSGGGETIGIIVSPSNQSSPIVVDLSSITGDCKNNIYEISHIANIVENNLTFRKDVSIWNLQNNSAAIVAQQIANGTSYPSMYMVNLYCNTNTADITGGIITIILDFTDFSGTPRSLTLGTINTIDQTTNPILSISTPIYAIGSITISVSGSLGLSSYDIQISTTKLN